MILLPNLKLKVSQFGSWINNFQNIKIQRMNSFIVFLASVSLASFGTKTTHYQIECISIENDGSIILNIWDPIKGSKYKLQQAQINAVHCILYSGISNTNNCPNQPALLRNNEERRAFEKIKKGFFSKSGPYLSFARNSTRSNIIPQKRGDRHWKVYQVTISKNELRKYLEEQKITQPLTKGF